MFKPSPGERDLIVDAMRAGVDYHFRIKCRNLEVTVRPLSIDEENEIIANVSEYMESLPPAARTSLRENTALAKEYLKAASTIAPDQETIRLWDESLKKMTPAEINHLYRQYVQACERVNPALEKMKPDELNSLVERLKKNTGEELDSALIELSFLELMNACRALILGG